MAGRSLAAVALYLVASVATMRSATLEDKLKVAFVSKFPQFVEWPPSVFDGRRTLDVCVADAGHFLTDLRDLAAGETMNGRPVAARRVSRAREVDDCQVLFLPSMRGGKRNVLLRRARSLPVLTVSDDPRFLAEGGIIALRLVNGRLRFDVDVGAARRVGLRISSQLLRLAFSVRGDGR